MTDLQSRISAANSLLSPKAMKHGTGRGRVFPEPEDETRFPFQRDRDRIIHSQAFRRLMGKTQVFVAGESDHFRTRLTHTMEVAQLSRDIARTLRLNEDLAECIALAHDLGHPPFGHTGETAMNEWMQGHGSHFEHNEQSIRIVTLLEEHSGLFPGLNLNHEVIDGLKKHEHLQAEMAEPQSLESKLVNLADEIAYTAHDTDDGLQAGLFAESDLCTTRLGTTAMESSRKRQTSVRGALIHLIVTDLYAQGEEIRFSQTMRTALDELRKFLWDNMYMHPRVTDDNKRRAQLIPLLSDMLLKDPPAKVLELQKRTGSNLVETVKDYVSGMTDGYIESQSNSI